MLISQTNLLIYIILPLYFFILLFRPPIVRIDLTYMLIVVDLFIILMCNGAKLKIKKNILNQLGGFIPFLLYFAVVQIGMISFESKTYTYVNAFTGILKIFAFIIFTLLALTSIIDKYRFSLREYVYVMTVAFYMQLVCVVLAFVFPDIKTYFLNLIYKNSPSDTIIAATIKESFFRCYGLADNLFDSLGYISALGISLLFGYGIKNEDKFIIVSSLLFIIIPLLNTRTGLLLSIIGIIIVLFLNFEFKKILKYLIAVIAVILVARFGFSKLPIEIQHWINVALDATINLTKGQTNSAYSEILSNDIVWPANIIIGQGASPEALGLYEGIDSGYVQCIWRFGVLGTIILFFGFLHMFRGTKGACNGKLIIPIITIFFLYLIKLYGIFNLGSVIVVFGLPIMIIENDKLNNMIIEGVK